MSDKIERVARAIADNIQAALPDGVTVDYEYAARAAIGAMDETYLWPAKAPRYQHVSWREICAQPWFLDKMKDV